jgi:hypothetical protein
MERTTIVASAKHIIEAEATLIKCELGLFRLNEIINKTSTCRRIFVEANGNPVSFHDTFTDEEMLIIASAMEVVIAPMVEKRKKDLESYMIGKQL